MPEQPPPSDIELISGAIRTIEEIRADMLAVLGLSPTSQRLGLQGGRPVTYWHDRLFDIRAHLQLVYQRRIVEQVPQWAEDAAKCAKLCGRRPDSHLQGCPYWEYDGPRVPVDMLVVFEVPPGESPSGP